MCSPRSGVVWIKKMSNNDERRLLIISSKKKKDIVKILMANICVISINYQ